MKPLIVGLVVAVVLAGCSRPTDRPEGSQSFVIAQQREPLSLNPALENGTSSTQWGLLLFQYLVKWNDRGQLVGDAATQYPTQANGGISKDGLTITYHLRRGLRFADGAALTASDCVWSIGAVNNPANNVQTRYGYDRIQKAVALDPHTLVLHLKEPFAPLPTLVLAPNGFPILPEHILSKLDFNHGDFGSHPIGSGPYVVTNWERNDKVEMRANPYYVGREPKIKAMTVRFVSDPTSAINLLKTREAAGFFDDQDFGNYPMLQSIPGVRAETARINGVGAIIFNTKDPITADPRVRHALAEAIDIHALIAKTYRGAITSDRAGAGLFLWAYDAKAYPDIPYNVSHAQALLDSAGWKVGADHVRRKDGRPLDILFAIQAQTPGDAIIGNVVTEEERQIGARVTLKQFNITQFVAPANLGGPVYGGKFQMALYPFVNGDDPDVTDQFACANVPPNGYNKSRFCEPRVDALLAAARRTYDTTLRKTLYIKLQAILYAQLPIALLYQRREVDAFTDRLQNQNTTISGAFGNVGAWRLER